MTHRLKPPEEKLPSIRVETLFRLSRAVAHDFNNLLMPIVGSATLLENEIPVAEHAHSRIDRIKVASNRAQELTKQLLAFSKQDPVEDEEIELNAVLSSIDLLLRAVTPKQIVLDFRFAAVSPRMFAKEGAIRELILDLVALVCGTDRSSEGTLSLITKQAELGAEEVSAFPPDSSLTPGSYPQLQLLLSLTRGDATANISELPGLKQMLATNRCVIRLVSSSPTTTDLELLFNTNVGSKKES